MSDDSNAIAEARAQLRRSALIARLKIRGHTLLEIAAKAECSVATVKRSWREFKELAAESFSEEDPEEVVWLALAELDGLKAEMYGVLESPQMVANVNAKVGAARAIGDFLERQLELRMAVGKLPKNLGELAVRIDIRSVQTKLVAVLKEHDVSDELVADLVDALGGGAAKSRGIARSRVLDQQD